jgi:hypothetical protein
MPTPPLPVVEVPVPVDVVAGGGVVVVGAGVVVVGAGVLVVVGVDVVGVLVVVGVEVVVGVLVVVAVVAGAVVAWAGHFDWTSARRLAAPWATALLRDESTPDRLLAEFCRFPAALTAAAQLCDARAAAIEFSWALSVLPWSVDSRLPLLPQAASSDTATPNRPARSARGTKRIRV